MTCHHNPGKPVRFIQSEVITEMICGNNIFKYNTALLVPAKMIIHFKHINKSTHRGDR